MQQYVQYTNEHKTANSLVVGKANFRNMAYIESNAKNTVLGLAKYLYNKKCGRRVRPTRYVPTGLYDTHWAKTARTDHVTVTLRP